MRISLDGRKPEGEWASLNEPFGKGDGTRKAWDLPRPASELRGLHIMRDFTILSPDGKRLDFVLERTGNQSVHGDLKASFLPRAGKPRTLGEINGLSVFSPNPLRKVAMALEGAAPAGPGRIQLTYTSAEEPSGELLAERSLDLP